MGYNNALASSCTIHCCLLQVLQKEAEKAQFLALMKAKVNMQGSLGHYASSHEKMQFLSVDNLLPSVRTTVFVLSWLLLQVAASSRRASVLQLQIDASICVCSCLRFAADCNWASPEGTGTRDPYANSSKPFASNDGTAAESIRLDLSDRGNKRKPSRSKAAIEAVKQRPAEQTQLRQRSVSSGSSDEDGAYIPPSEIASYPVPMPRKATNNRKPPPVSKDNDFYLQM